MLPVERVAAAFDHHSTDRVPIYQAGFSSYVASYVLGRDAFVGGGIQQHREAVALWEGGRAHEEFLERSFTDACDLCEKLDLDLVRTSYWRKPEKPAARIDDHTFQYGNRDKGAYWEVWRFDPPTETYGAIDRQERPDPSLPDLARLADAALAKAERYNPSVSDFPDAGRAMSRFGGNRAMPGAAGVSIAVPREPAWLEACILAPETVSRYLDAAVVTAEKNIRVMNEMGLRYLYGGGDFAGAGGPLYSPRVFRELMLPRLQKISARCRETGAYHMFASDGDLWPVADDLFGASGVSAFYEVDRNFMDPEAMKQRFPGVVLLGGIRSEMLHLGTASEVADEARTAIHAAKAYGGMIVGCSNQIVAGTPEANFWSMMETLEAYR